MRISITILMLTTTRKWIQKSLRTLTYFMCVCYNPRDKMDCLDKEVEEANWKNTKPFIPQIKACKVIKVYDGDTVTVAAKLHESFPVNRFSVRLSGIDTPELRSNHENEKKRAIIAKTFLQDKILNQTVFLENITTEKYGRLLATIIHNDVNINLAMIENNYAVPYSGGKKETPAEWLEDL